MTKVEFPNTPIDGRQRHSHPRARDGHGADYEAHAHDAGTEHLIEITSDIEYGPADDEERSCSWCGGDGYQECDDPIGCLSRHLRDGSCPCGACGGSGLAKDQTIW